MNKVIKLAFFIKDITPALMKLGEYFYHHFQGDAARTRAEITRIQDHWADFDEENARIDRENQEIPSRGN